MTLALAYGIWYSYSVFLVALLAEFGWSRSLVAGAFSVFALVHGFGSPTLGWLADRLGPRRLVAIGGVVLACGLFLDGAVTRPWQLYLAFGLVTSIGVATAGWVPAVVLVQRWFPERVGLALGIASAGIGVGIFLVVPFCQLLIQYIGWRSAYRTMGVLALLWILPATLALLRDPPVVSAVPAARGTSPGFDAASGRHDVTLHEATRTRAFWFLAVAQLLGNSASQMLLVHQAAYLVDHGLTALIAASVVSVVGLSSISGKIGGGWLSDSVGREITYSIGMACVIASIFTLGLVALAPGPLPAYVYGVLIGLGYSVTAALMPAVINDVFRGRHFGAIFGMLHLGNAFGGSLGPWFAGRVFDVTGTYRPAFVVAILFAATATAALWMAAPRRQRAMT